MGANEEPGDEPGAFRVLRLVLSEQYSGSYLDRRLQEFRTSFEFIAEKEGLEPAIKFILDSAGLLELE